MLNGSGVAAALLPWAVIGTDWVPGAAVSTNSRLALLGSSMGCIGVQTVFWLACAEGNNAPDRIVRRDADGHAISRNDLDAEAAHSAAELGQHFVAGVALHAVKTATVNRHNRALHVNEIVLAQTASDPFLTNKYCATSCPQLSRHCWPQPVAKIVTPENHWLNRRTASSTRFASAS